MQAIRNAVKLAFERNQWRMLDLPKGDPEIEILARTQADVSEIITLSEWQREQAAQRAPGWDGVVRRVFQPFDEDAMRLTAQYNEMMSRNLKLEYTHPLHTLHLFMDEFDSEPSDTKFARDSMAKFVNTCYRYAERVGIGNDADFLQLIVAMNKSWAEFIETYGKHIARRINEMCVTIDFDSGVKTDPLRQANAPDAVDRALAKDFEGLLVECPANFEPVCMRETGAKGAGDGTRKEAYA
jgi:hypothetical protein